MQRPRRNRNLCAIHDGFLRGPVQLVETQFPRFAGILGIRRRRHGDGARTPPSSKPGSAERSPAPADALPRRGPLPGDPRAPPPWSARSAAATHAAALAAAAAAAAATATAAALSHCLRSSGRPAPRSSLLERYLEFLQDGRHGQQRTV